MTAQVRSTLESKELEFVGKPVIAKLATIGMDGAPHVIPVWFMYEQGRFLVTAAEKSVKVRNIKRDNRVTLLIDDASPHLLATYKYVLVKGRAEINDDSNVENERERLGIRYLGEEAGRKWLSRVLKVKFVIVEIIPEEVSSLNL